MHICYLGLGSNLGDRRNNIESAVRKISALKNTKIIAISKIIETNPIGGPSGQGRFLNAAAKIKTSLSPKTLLKSLKNIEHELGRIKTIPYGPRIIDLDVLLYASKIINTKELKVPHPKMFDRDFVLVPLSQIWQSKNSMEGKN